MTFWPNVIHYQLAIQNPQNWLSDSELRNGRPIWRRRGQLEMGKGGFAIIFPLICNQQKWGVRCFLYQDVNREERYQRISSYLNANRKTLPCMVHFEYFNQGIIIENKPFPILKMEWIEGIELLSYIKKNLKNPHKFKDLAEKFRIMVNDLNKHHIAHGDLSHRNILIYNEQIKLIDYDGMFVPDLHDQNASEVGQDNFQHPARKKESNLNHYFDHFSTWVIYLSLLALSIDPSLWSRYIVPKGEENLLFCSDDYNDPEHSEIFKTLEHFKDENVRKYARRLKFILSWPDISQIPPLEFLITGAGHVGSATTSLPIQKYNPPLKKMWYQS